MTCNLTFPGCILWSKINIHSKTQFTTMGPEIIGVMIPIITVIGIITMIIFLRYYENIERMALIEKGLNPYTNKPKQRLNPSVTLRFALLSIGAGSGILFANVLINTTGIIEEVAFFSMILIFGGLGLLASYLFELRMSKKEDEEERRKLKYEQSV